jgi:hypothetical protein
MPRTLFIPSSEPSAGILAQAGRRPASSLNAIVPWLAVKGKADLDQLGFQKSGSLAVARSGTINWVDPFVGLRVRHQLTPGHELQFLGDVGGFDAGSDFSWQLFGGYSFDFGVWQTTLHGLVGYRALAVDYSQDSAAKQNSVDLILHGPVIGLSFRW